jgi:hypothetical protein
LWISLRHALFGDRQGLFRQRSHGNSPLARSRLQNAAPEELRSRLGQWKSRHGSQIFRVWQAKVDIKSGKSH